MAEINPRPEIEPEPEDEGEAIEGTVVPFPGAVVPVVPARPQRGQPGEWKPVIPEHLRDRAGIAKAARWHYRRARHHALYHGVHAPGRLAVTLGWAIVGLTRITFAQLSWWWLSEQTYLRHSAAADGDAAKWLQLNKHAREVRLTRGLLLLGEGIVVIGGGTALTVGAPLLWIPIGLVAVRCWRGSAGQTTGPS